MKTSHILIALGALFLLWLLSKKKQAETVAATNNASFIPVNVNPHSVQNGIDALSLVYVPAVGHTYPNVPLFPGIGGVQGLPGTAVNGATH